MKRNNNKQNWLIKWWDKNKPDTFLTELKEYSMKKRIAIMISSLFFAIYFFISFGIFEYLMLFKERYAAYGSLELIIPILASTAVIVVSFIIFIYIHIKLLNINIKRNLQKLSKLQVLIIFGFSFALMMAIF